MVEGDFSLRKPLTGPFKGSQSPPATGKSVGWQVGWSVGRLVSWLLASGKLADISGISGISVFSYLSTSFIVSLFCRSP